MQDKQSTHRHKLLAQRDDGRNKNQNTRDIVFFLIAGYALFGELYEVNYTRIFCALCLLYSLRHYNQTNNRLDKPILYYDAQRQLRQAARNNDTKLLQNCLDVLGNDAVNLPGPESGRTALHFAVRAVAVNTTEMLIAAGANINVQDTQGDTPVHSILNSLKEKPTAAKYSILAALLKRSDNTLKSNQPLVGNGCINPFLINISNKKISDLIDEVGLTNDTALNSKHRDTKELILTLTEKYHLEEEQFSTMGVRRG